MVKVGEKKKSDFIHLEKIFKIISKCEKGDDIYRYIETKNSTTDFARLN